MAWVFYGRLINFAKRNLCGVQAVARRAQRGIFYVLMFMLPISIAAIEIAFFLLLIGWIVEHLPSGWRSSVWRGKEGRWYLIALLVYLSICALSIVTSSYPPLSLRGFIGKTLQWALYFVIAADVAREPRMATRCLSILMASAFVVGLDALVQEAIGRDLLLGHSTAAYCRMSGPYTNPVDLATYLIVVIPIVLIRWAESPRGRRWRQGFLLVLLLGCLIRTESQGAWLGLLGGFGLIALRRRTLRKAVLVLCLSLLIGGGAHAYSQGRLLSRMQFTDAGKQDRKYMWTAAWHMVKARPVLGLGLNTFMANYLTYWVGGERQPRYAHNCFLQVAAETGFLGLAAFLWLLGVMTWCWWRLCRLLSDDSSRAALLGLMSGLVGFLIQSAFDTNFYSLRHAALFWTLAGLATGLAIMAQPTTSGQESC